MGFYLHLQIQFSILQCKHKLLCLKCNSLKSNNGKKRIGGLNPVRFFVAKI